MASRSEAGNVAPVLEVFGDYACPYSWLLHHELGRLGSGAAVHLVIRAVELWPAPTRLPDAATLRAEWEAEIEPLARELGVHGRLPRAATRTRKAHELAAFARSRDRGAAVHAALFDARFERDLDIGRIDVLVELAEEAGLDRTEARIALDIDQFADVVAADRERAAALGVSGLPAIVRPRDDAPPAMHLGFTDAASLRRWIDNGQGTGSG